MSSSSSTSSFVDQFLVESAQIAARTSRDEVVGVIDLLFAAYKAGGTIFTCGNGGSAANASHLAADLAIDSRPRNPTVPGYFDAGAIEPRLSDQGLVPI